MCDFVNKDDYLYKIPYENNKNRFKELRFCKYKKRRRKKSLKYGFGHCMSIINILSRKDPTAKEPILEVPLHESVSHFRQIGCLSEW